MPDWIIQLFGMVGAAGAIYGGIRADLRHALGCAQEAKSEAQRANNRIDTLLSKGGRHG